jgi:DNA-binding transcriptional LysR family regulator
VDTRHIRAAIAVQRYGSFTDAALALFVSQPTLSRQIASLERELGGALFVRGARRVELTPLGRAFLPAAQEVLDTVARAQDAARAGCSTLSPLGHPVLASRRAGSGL